MSKPAQNSGARLPARQPSIAERVAKLAWFDCADGATRRELAERRETAAAEARGTAAPKQRAQG